MALIQLGSLVSNLKGSIGGTTFSNNPAGLTAKSRLQGKHAMTSKQSFALSLSQEITHIWTMLTPSLKVSWNSFAESYPFTDRYGNVKPLTGFQYFKMTVSSAYYCGISISVEPPTFIAPDSIPAMTITCTSTDLRVSFSTPLNPLTTKILVYCSGPSKFNGRINRGALRILNIGAVDYTSDFSIKTAWEAVFNLNWNSIALSGKFNINVLVVPVQATTALSGTSASANGNT